MLFIFEYKHSISRKKIFIFKSCNKFLTNCVKYIVKYIVNVFLFQNALIMRPISSLLMLVFILHSNISSFSVLPFLLLYAYVDFPLFISFSNSILHMYLPFSHTVDNFSLITHINELHLSHKVPQNLQDWPIVNFMLF